ncbi:hypothetical protein VUR80DRAFT_10306 [Thermomyces stellatus]
MVAIRPRRTVRLRVRQTSSISRVPRSKSARCSKAWAIFRTGGSCAFPDRRSGKYTATLIWALIKPDQVLEATKRPPIVPPMGLGIPWASVACRRSLCPTASRPVRTLTNQCIRIGEQRSHDESDIVGRRPFRFQHACKHGTGRFERLTNTPTSKAGNLIRGYCKPPVAKQSPPAQILTCEPFRPMGTSLFRHRRDPWERSACGPLTG